MARISPDLADESFNQPKPLADINLFDGDVALVESCGREGLGEGLHAFGATLGTAQSLEDGVLANRFAPELDTHDRGGRRIDVVRYHEAYHRLMRRAVEAGLHASPWTRPGPGAHGARAAGFYMQTQVEAGHLCPITMSFAATASLRHAPSLAAEWLPKLHATIYDPANVPAAAKAGVTMGMAMTERQGGSDVRANVTRAVPQGDGAYAITGHKFFLSAPMSDAFLMLAQAPSGLTCFLAPRWRPDGRKNEIELIRLKQKMGNRSNASAETEWRGALGHRIGEEGRGVATILEMVAMTRFDCVVGSAAGMRWASAQTIDWARQRRTFGAVLATHPVMANVLADLAVESEAALVLAMRLARALDSGERALLRIALPLAKYWVCKRAPAHAYEAMECFGGLGFMEDSPMPRLYREAPVNAIWEGSGNIQALDVIRAIQRADGALEALFKEIDEARGAHRALDEEAAALRRDCADVAGFERRARELCDRLAVALQASLLTRAAPDMIARAFVAGRLDAKGAHHYGALPIECQCPAIVDRAAAR